MDGVEVGGLATANPVWVGSSELTMTLEGITACVDAGAGAVVAKSVNESAAAREQLAIADYAFVSAGGEARPPGTGRPGDGLLNRSGLAAVDLDDWLAMLASAVSRGAARSCPVLGSITLGDPAAAARHIWSALAEGGTWMVVEPIAGDSPEENFNPLGRIRYGFSTLVCTPGSLSQPGRAGLGTLAGAPTWPEVFRKAGFTHFRRAAETPFNMVFDVRA